jgi:histidinol-phosphatase (PHP family)
MHNGSVFYDSHMHTPLCKHARGELEEYAKVAHRRGLEGIVFTCHNPTNDGWSPNTRMSMAEFDIYIRMVARARAAWAGQVDIRLGLECDYVPGMEPWLEKLTGLAEFHHVLGSVHPHLKDYKERYFDGDFVAFQRTYFEHLAMAAETGLFDTIAHPDLVKIVAPSEWNPDRMMDVIRRCLDRIAAVGTAMELNTSGLAKALAETSPGTAMLEEMHKRNIPVVIGSDAHAPQRVATAFEDALDILSATGYTHINIVLDRKRKEIPIAEARQSLRATGAEYRSHQ